MITPLLSPIEGQIVILDETIYQKKRKKAIGVKSVEDISEDYDTDYALKLYQILAITSTNEYGLMLNSFNVIGRGLTPTIQNHIKKMIDDLQIMWECK